MIGRTRPKGYHTFEAFQEDAADADKKGWSIRQLVITRAKHQSPTFYVIYEKNDGE